MLAAPNDFIHQSAFSRLVFRPRAIDALPEEMARGAGDARLPRHLKALPLRTLLEEAW